ncbi:MAG: lipopolysaccharide biosynthesis protein, partial [Acidobacteria bacterium]
MELGRHLGKGIWGLADKALPVFYGLGYVLLVIRVLPEEEFGNWVLLQEVFLLVSGLATAFALNPLLKYAAEAGEDHRDTVTAALLLNGGFLVVSSVVLIAVRRPLGMVFNSAHLADLLVLLPAMLAASFIRNLALVLLQSRFLIREQFFTDAVHFLGAPFLTWVWSRLHAFDTATDLVAINIISLTCSSLAGLVFTRGLIRLTPRPAMDAVRKVWTYGVYSLGGILSSLFSGRADSFVLAAFTGPVHVAVYNSVKIFIRAYEMVTQVVQMFMLPGASRFSSRGETASLKIVVEKSLLFGTVAMVPVFLGFFFLADPLVRLVYQGRYLEGIPQLQLFAFLSFFIPATAVATSTLLGLGEARTGFVLGLQSLAVAAVLYVAAIPPLGVTGATLGYVLSSVVLCVLAMRQLRRVVPFTLGEVVHRWWDIDAY